MRLLFFTFIISFTILFSESMNNFQSTNENLKRNVDTILNKEKSSVRVNSRNFTRVFLDSSKNGYGAFLNINSPLSYSFDACNDGENAGWLAVYRQFGGLDQTAGFLGATQSDPSGENWTTPAQKINKKYPEGQEWRPNSPTDTLPTSDGAPGARYPSSVISSWQNKPAAVWNEYTIPTYGGGESGGVPMYSYDFFGLGEGDSWTLLKHLNRGCESNAVSEGSACDPPDLWQANVQLIEGFNDPINEIRNCNYVGGAHYGGGNPRLLAMYTSWAADPVYGETYPKYMIRSRFLTNGIINVDEPVQVQQDSLDSDGFGNCLWLDCGNGYTGTPDFHVNSRGTGYLALTSLPYDSTEAPFLHTIFFRHTEDYGETWSSTGGFKNSGYYHLSDSELMEIHDSLLTLWSTYPEIYSDKPWYPWAADSLGNIIGDTLNFTNDTTALGVPYDYFYTSAYFIHYEYDVITDQDGGIHFAAFSYPYICKDLDGGCLDSDLDGIADSAYSYLGIGAGMYHYYNPDPVMQPDNWSVSFIEDYSTAMNLDWPETGPMSLYTDEAFYFEPTIRPSYEEGSQVLWYASTNVSSFISDSILGNVPTDLDIYMAKSVDNGRTWTVPENVTNTPGLATDDHIEYGFHLANIGSDDEIGLFYQVPNFDFKTVDDSDDWMDYMTALYFLKYTNDLEYLSTDIETEKDVLPNSFVLNQNYPNPFNPITNISFGIERASNVKLSLYDVRGRFIETLINERITAGSHDFLLDASHLSSGVYFYTMTVEGVRKTRKLILMK